MTKTKYDLAVTFGRFNLLHRGHVDMFERMADLALDCLIGVSTGPGNLPADQRVAVIEKAIGINGIVAEVMGSVYDTAKAGNPFAFFEYVTAGPGRVVLVLGEDQEGLAKAAERVLGWDYHLVRRLGSSTEVRSLIDNEQWDRLVDVVPAEILGDVCRLRALELKK
jgi:glycerol-3-phosphate cytidylyltransferase-like family protein